jgi:hypothetical protein
MVLSGVFETFLIVGDGENANLVSDSVQFLKKLQHYKYTILHFYGTTVIGHYFLYQ